MDSTARAGGGADAEEADVAVARGGDGEVGVDEALRAVERGARVGLKGNEPGAEWPRTS